MRVARDVTAKMHHRNPHVFGEQGEAGARSGRPLTAAEVNDAWEAVKATEKAAEKVGS